MPGEDKSRSPRGSGAQNGPWRGASGRFESRKAEAPADPSASEELRRKAHEAQLEAGASGPPQHNERKLLVPNSAPGC